MERFRPRLVKKGVLTEAGIKGHQLVRTDHVLKNNADPEVSFAMSPPLVEQYTQSREQLIEDLGISQKPRIQERRIAQIKEELMQEGFPYWLINHESRTNRMD